jgi:hypothetical protein
VIGLFKHNNPLAFLLLIALALIPFFGQVVDLKVMNTATAQPAILEKALKDLLSTMGSDHPWISSMSTVFVLLIEALLLNKMVSDQKLLETPGLLPAMSFLLLNAVAPFKVSAFVLLGNLVILLLLRIFIVLYKSSKPNNLLLAAGFAAGMLALLKAPYLVLFIWLCIALLIMRPASMKETMIMATGFVLPAYFLAAGLYLIDHAIFANSLSKINPGIQLPRLNTVASTRLSFFLALPWVGLAVNNRHISKMMILNRKTYIVVLLLFVILILASVLDQAALPSLLHMAIVPGSLMLANLFSSFKKHYLPNLILIGLLALSLIR